MNKQIEARGRGVILPPNRLARAPRLVNFSRAVKRLGRPYRDTQTKIGIARECSFLTEAKGRWVILLPNRLSQLPLPAEGGRPTKRTALREDQPFWSRKVYERIYFQKLGPREVNGGKGKPKGKGKTNGDKPQGVSKTKEKRKEADQQNGQLTGPSNFSFDSIL